MTDFARTRALFDLPEGVIYLDGNSLGPLPAAAKDRVATAVAQEWGQMLIGGWNKGANGIGWMAQPAALGDRIGRLIGAEAGHVTIGDTLSIKVWQALAACVQMNPTRKVILSDSGNFPSDLYMAQGLTQLLGQGYELRVVAPEEVGDAITDELCVLMLTEVDYRTGRRHDMKALTAKAHAMGGLAIWDLAHSAGALPVDVSGGGADFAAGCTYKYLNGGPGAPAFIYVAPRHAETAPAALSGWLGHAAPFAFEQAYRAGSKVERMRVGTPPVIQMAALDAAMDIWDTVEMEDIRKMSLHLADRFITGITAACPDLQLATPLAHEERGSQVSFYFHEGYAAIQALIAHGVVGDFRAPDIMRFGFTPLFLNEADIDKAVAIFARVMNEKLWDDPAFKTRARVT